MKELPLPGGRVALVDDDVWEWASGHRWHLHPQGYVARYIHHPDGRRAAALLRRQIMGADRGVEVINWNGDQLDNRRENLRILTPEERAKDRAARFRQTGPPSSHAAGYRGVTWDRSQETWQARIRVAGRLRHLGFFATAAAAARV